MSPRIVLDAQVMLSTGRDDVAEEGRVVNLSTGGAFVSTAHPHAIGDVLQATLQLASGGQVEGAVKVCSRLADHGNGVAFFNLAPEQRFTIESLIRRHGPGRASEAGAARNVYAY